MQLKNMAQFASIFEEDEIGRQPVVQIPWGTINVIMNKSSSKEEMLWYINQTHRNRRSRTMVVKQFEAKAYQRNMIESITTKETSMKGLKTSIGISKYKLLEDLPNYLSSRVNALE